MQTPNNSIHDPQLTTRVADVNIHNHSAYLIEGSPPLYTCITPSTSCFFFFKQKTVYEISECDWSSDVCSSDRRFFFFKQKTAYEISECDWSSDVCSSDRRPP